MLASGVRPQGSKFPNLPKMGGVKATATREWTNERDALRGQRERGVAGYKSRTTRSLWPDGERSRSEVRSHLMVACAVAHSSALAHSTSSVVGGGEGGRRAPVASPEVARSAPAPAKALPHGTMAAQLTPAASIEQLKQQLQTAIENKDCEKATIAIEQLERVNLSKEILESTRIGLCVNEARKGVAELWPALAKRCRGLIKAWQKLVEPTTNSSSASTSRNGTPGLVSPAVGRRLTPHTPANNKRITPGIASERASNLSPGANGSYAPKGNSLLSPGMGMHKSHSVGYDLQGGENGGAGAVRNGKRKQQDEPVPGTVPSSIKRAKTTASGLSTVGLGGSSALTSPAPGHPPATPSLIEARRAAMQPTSDLVAALTSNLPQRHGFEDGAKEHAEKVKREAEDQQLAAALANGGEPTSSPYLAGKRKYERKQKPTLTGAPSTPSFGGGGASASSSSTSTTKTMRIVTPPPDEEGKGGIKLKFSLSRTTTDAGSLAQQAATPASSASTAGASAADRKEEKERRKREKREAAALHASKSAPALAHLVGAQAAGDDGPSTSGAGASTATSAWLAKQKLNNNQPGSSTATSDDGAEPEAVKKKPEKIDWSAMVPSIEELQARASKTSDRRRMLAAMTDSEKAYTLKLGSRVVLALPYIEIDDRPDFLKFNYPDPGRFYAEENFIGGIMERPVFPAPTTSSAAPPAAASDK